MLSERYAKHLRRIQNKSLNKDDCRLLLRSSTVSILNDSFSNSDEPTHETGFEDKSWDDMDDKSIKAALDEVIRCKRMAKLEASKRVGSAYKEWSDLNRNAEGYVNAPNPCLSFLNTLVLITSKVFNLRVQPLN